MSPPRLIPELVCSEIGRSLRFYVDVLGFAIVYARPEEGFAMLDREGARLMLDQRTDGPRTWLTGPLDPPFGRGINLQIAVADVDALHARVLASGLTLFLAMEERWYRVDAAERGNRQFLVQDPDGYLLRFFQDLGARPLPSRTPPPRL